MLPIFYDEFYVRHSSISLSTYENIVIVVLKVGYSYIDQPDDQSTK